MICIHFINSFWTKADEWKTLKAPSNTVALSLAIGGKKREEKVGCKYGNW
jgi:hypothetical protein